MEVSEFSRPFVDERIMIQGWRTKEDTERETGRERRCQVPQSFECDAHGRVRRYGARGKGTEEREVVLGTGRQYDIQTEKQTDRRNRPTDGEVKIPLRLRESGEERY